MRKMKKLYMLVALLAVAGMAFAAENPMAGCCKKMGGVQRTVANIENGVTITMTATDPKVVAMIQEHTATCGKGMAGCKDCPMHAEGVSRSIAKTATGVVITATATTPELVKKLQAHAGAMDCGHGKQAHAGMMNKGGTSCAHGEQAHAGMMNKGGKSCAHGEQAHLGMSKDCPMHAEGVSRTIEKTATGVVITLTGSTPELVKMLQAHADGKSCGHGEQAHAGMSKDGKSCCAKGQAAKAPSCPNQKSEAQKS